MPGLLLTNETFLTLRVSGMRVVEDALLEEDERGGFWAVVVAVGSALEFVIVDAAQGIRQAKGEDRCRDGGCYENRETFLEHKIRCYFCKRYL